MNHIIVLWNYICLKWSAIQRVLFANAHPMLNVKKSMQVAFSSLIKSSHAIPLYHSLLHRHTHNRTRICLHNWRWDNQFIFLCYCCCCSVVIQLRKWPVIYSSSYWPIEYLYYSSRTTATTSKHWNSVCLDLDCSAEHAPSLFVLQENYYYIFM